MAWKALVNRAGSPSIARALPDRQSRTGRTGGCDRHGADYVRRGVELDVAYLVKPSRRPRRPGRRPGPDCSRSTGTAGRAGWASPRPSGWSPRRPDLVRTTLFRPTWLTRIEPNWPGAGRVQPGQRGLRRRPRRHSGVRRWKVRGARLVDAATAERVVRFHAQHRYIADIVRLGPAAPGPRDQLEGVIPQGERPGAAGAARPGAPGGVAPASASPDTALLVAVARHEREGAWTPC